MPDPRTRKQISIKITSGTATSGVYVRCTNGTTGNFQVKKTNIGNEVIFDLNSLSSDGTDTGTKSGVANGDVISYQASGYGFGGGTHTVSASKGGKKVPLTVTDRTTSNTIGVSI